MRDFSYISRRLRATKKARSFLILLILISAPIKSFAAISSRNCVHDAAKYPDVRQAYVVGNGSYSGSSTPAPGNWQTLGATPVNDADDIADALCHLGFDVTIGKNVSEAEFRSILAAASAAEPAHGIRLFYYSGHGMQHKSTNYLVPVSLSAPNSIGVPLTDIYAALDKNSRLGGNTGLLKIIILDACRTDNNSDDAAGFVQPSDAPTSTFIAYSTAPDSTADASSAASRNSLYTSLLLKRMGVPGETLEGLFDEVRTAVYKESRHRQIPWENTSALGAFMFEPPLKFDRVDFKSPSPDDLVIISVNDVPVIKTWREQADIGWQPVPVRLLHAGTNGLTVEVYNDKTRQNGLPWGDPEGWRFELLTRINEVERPEYHFLDTQNVPDSARWGTLFTTLRAQLLVDSKTGAVTITSVQHVPHP